MAGRRRLITMARRRHTPEQIIRKLREADRLLAEGADVAEVARHLEVHLGSTQPRQAPALDGRLTRLGTIRSAASCRMPDGNSRCAPGQSVRRRASRPEGPGPATSARSCTYGATWSAGRIERTDLGRPGSRRPGLAP